MIDPAPIVSIARRLLGRRSGFAAACAACLVLPAIPSRASHHSPSQSLVALNALGVPTASRVDWWMTAWIQDTQKTPQAHPELPRRGFDMLRVLVLVLFLLAVIAALLVGAVAIMRWGRSLVEDDEASEPTEVVDVWSMHVAPDIDLEETDGEPLKPT